MRKPFIAGNWKMFKNKEETKAFISELKPLCKGINKRDVAVCVPFTSIETAKKAARGSKIRIGAQNMSWADEGAFTGEISAGMLLDVGTELVILGHSERRAMFNETDQAVNNKLKQSLKYGLKPIVCVGESLQEKESGHTQAILSDQLSIGLDGLLEQEMEQVTIAYEPIWAIGTGKTASAELANEEIKFIRKKVSQMFSGRVAKKVRILYGGSVKPTNFASFMAMSDIDGALVGGASLTVKDFIGIINYEEN